MEHVKRISLEAVHAQSLHSKYYIVLLSKARNLDLCRKYQIAGFPDTENGRWAYLDIDIGSYITFYSDARYWDVYEVVGKEIPFRWKTVPKATGPSEMDPEPVGPGDHWQGIDLDEKGYLYFPFRLRLRRVKEMTVPVASIFTPGLIQLGLNMLPRRSFTKSHIQIPFSMLSRLFHIELPQKQTKLDLMSFVESGLRARKLEDAAKELKICGDICKSEKYLQALFKKFFEAFRSEFSFSAADPEFFSEQHVVGGAADLMIEDMNQAYEQNIFEVKLQALIKRLGDDYDLTKEGEKALDEVKGYCSIFGEDKTQRSVASFGSLGSNGIDVFYHAGIEMMILDRNLLIRDVCKS